MDYPKSVPGVGLVDGKFVDEDAVSGQVGSLIPSVWGNAVTDELLGVLAWADVEPDEADSGQLLKALHIIFATLDSPEFEGEPTAPTPPSGDGSERLATTEYVARAIGAIPTPPDPLDFTPVQQGTGVDQLSNIVKIGWTAKEGLKATVDATDQGSFVFQAALDTALADKVSGASGIRLKWEGRDGQPYWLFGGNSAADDVALYHPAAFSVNYANSAGSAPANGGTASYAHQLAGPGLQEGTIGSYRLNKNHTTSELGGAWELRGSSYDVGSGNDWNIGTRTCLWQRVG